MRTYRKQLSIGALGLMMIASGGCVRRTINITSSPEGALVWLNDREIGRTPVSVDFVYYGDYDVRLEKPGWEPLLTHGEAKPPLWDLPVIDLAAELVPLKLHSRIEWHYDMTQPDPNPDALMGRAEELRTRMQETVSGQTEE